MAKTTAWTGATKDGSWATAGNWTNGVPVSTDTVIFNYGSYDVTAGLNQAAVNLELLLVSSGYTGKIGLSGSLLQIDVNNDTAAKLAFAGGARSELWWTGAAASIFVETDSAGAVDLTGSGTIPSAVVTKGTVAVHGGTYTSLYIAHKNVQATDAAVTFTAGAITTAYVMGGTLTSPQTPTTLHVDGGMFVWTATSGTMTTTYIASGTFVWHGYGQTVTTMLLLGGSLIIDAVSSATITNSTVASPVSTISIKGGSRVTFTNATKFLVSSPGPSVETGSTITIGT